MSKVIRFLLRNVQAFKGEAYKQLCDMTPRSDDTMKKNKAQWGQSIMGG